MRWARHAGFWWGDLRERAIGRPRRRQMDKIKMGLKEMRRGGIDWIDMAQDRDRWHPLVSRVMNFWVHKMWGIY
jgi:hypothetical protein